MLSGREPKLPPEPLIALASHLYIIVINKDSIHSIIQKGRVPCTHLFVTLYKPSLRFYATGADDTRSLHES